MCTFGFDIVCSCLRALDNNDSSVVVLCCNLTLHRGRWNTCATWTWTINNKSGCYFLPGAKYYLLFGDAHMHVSTHSIGDCYYNLQSTSLCWFCSIDHRYQCVWFVSCVLSRWYALVVDFSNYAIFPRSLFSTFLLLLLSHITVDEAEYNRWIIKCVSLLRCVCMCMCVCVLYIIYTCVST